MSVGYSSLCSSSVATGMIFSSTNARTVLRISSWMSVRPSVSQRRPMCCPSGCGVRRPIVPTAQSTCRPGRPLWTGPHLDEVAQRVDRRVELCARRHLRRVDALGRNGTQLLEVTDHPQTELLEAADLVPRPVGDP